MVMSKKNYFDTAVSSIAPTPFDHLPPAVVEFASDSTPSILLKNFESDSIELVALDRRSIKIWHPEGPLVVIKALSSFVALVVSANKRSPFQSVSTFHGPPLLFAELPPRWTPQHGSTLAKWQSPPPSTASFVLGGIGLHTSNEVLGRALTHFLGPERPLECCFVTDTFGQVFLHCTLSSNDGVDLALAKNLLRSTTCRVATPGLPPTPPTSSPSSPTLPFYQPVTPTDPLTHKKSF